MTYPSARDGVESAKLRKETPQTTSSAYVLAYTDEEFLCREDLRPVRLQLELLKPEIVLQELGVESTFVIFGSSRIHEESAARGRLEEAEAALAAHPGDPALEHSVAVARRLVDNSKYYGEARKLAALVSAARDADGRHHFCVVTGGGPGIMEAANRGAHDIGEKSIGLNLGLPFEQTPNRFITPELCFQFHYFALRKMHFLMRAKALCVFPGGYGTLDELFETLTLIQTRKIEPMPMLLFGERFWKRVVDFDALIEEGTISPDDVRLFQYVETAEEAWKVVAAFYDIRT
ncbi:MAG: LOG family protein [Planctomycetota bacterium]|nr:LOG family protein [Planctomycetota bacterium]